MVAIHNEAPPGSLNNYETNWERYNCLQPEDTKRHLGLKTGLQGHVHALPSLRGGPNGWAGEPDVHGMVDKEVVRALLEPEGLTSTDHEWALRRQKLGNMVPMNALHAHQEITRVILCRLILNDIIIHIKFLNDIIMFCKIV